MITIFHGNGLTAMSAKISSLKKGFDPLSVVELSGKEISFDSAFLKISTPNFFSESRLFILEDFGDLDLDKVEEIGGTSVVFKFNKVLPKNSLIFKGAQEKNIQVQVFEEPGETPIFPFLDKLGEKNPKALEEFEKFYNEWGGQYVLTMTGYLLRRLVVSSNKAPAFIRERIERQKKNFNASKLNNLYRNLAETDYKIKSGLLDEKIAITLFLEGFF